MTRFMTLDFADGDRPALLARVAVMARGSYGYVVTPNVDHVIKRMDGRVEAQVYDGAALKICDSRILAHLARLRGKTLAVYPGSDLTADLLAADHDLTIGVFGPDRAAFDDLVAAGSMASAKAAGKVRIEGKDYVMSDGDVVEFRFNV